MDNTSILGVAILFIGLCFILALTLYSRKIINRLTEKQNISAREIIREMQNEP